MGEWEDTDGFASLEEGMGAFVPDWDNDETTDLGRTQMRTPDSEQATRLNGRAFDELRRKHTPRQADSRPGATPAPVATPTPAPTSGDSSPWIAGVGVLGALVGVMVALVVSMLVLAWLSLRGGPERVAEGPGPAAPVEAPEPVSPGAGDGAPAPDRPDPGDPGEGDPDGADPPAGGEPEPTEPEAPQPAPVVPSGGFEARFPARFDFNQWTPRDVDQAALGALVTQMEARCGEVIVLTGHTDGVGPDGVNERFAIARASAARDLIAERSSIPKPNMVLASTIDDAGSGDEGRRVDVSCD